MDIANKEKTSFFFKGFPELTRSQAPERNRFTELIIVILSNITKYIEPDLKSDHGTDPNDGIIRMDHTHRRMKW